LNNLAKQMKDIRQENEFNEIDLKQFQDKLDKLNNELDQPTDLSIKQQLTAITKQILIVTSLETGKNV